MVCVLDVSKVFTLCWKQFPLMASCNQSGESWRAPGFQSTRIDP